MSLLATIRPDAWNFPLLLHVLGAMLMVGALVLAASALIVAWRDGNAALVRTGFRSLLIGALPAWVLMRAGAAWIADKEHLTDSKASWIGIGFTTADLGLVVLLLATVLGWLAVRRGARAAGPSGFSRFSAGLASVLIIGYGIAIWAMTTKPT
jgi:hypothetical protein